MYSGNQATILNEVSFFGKPKNMERVVNVKILPAEANSGITFKRVDLKENNTIKVDYKNIKIENDRFVLKNENGVSVSNFEFLIAGIWSAKMDNLLIEIDGESVPNIDGTSEPLSFVLTVGKVKELEKTRKVFELEQEIGIRVNNFEISVKPSKSFIINMDLDGKQFVFNNGELPFKDTLSKISEDSSDKLKYYTLLAASIIYFSNHYCNFEVSFKNFDKKITCDFFENLFNNRLA